MNILISLAIGALVGWLAKCIMGGKASLLLYIVIGIVGGGLGSWLAGLLGIGGGGLIWELLVGVGGSCLLIFIVRLLFGKGKKR